MQVKTKFELPWIEKYRPAQLSEIIDHQEKIDTLRALIARNELTHLIFYGSPGSGKCLGKGTLVRMYEGGLKKVEDIIVGDLLMGDDSTPRTVLSTCNGMDQLYKVKQERGIDYIVNEPHILSLMNSKDSYISWDKSRYAYQVRWYENHHQMMERVNVSTPTMIRRGTTVYDTKEEAYQVAVELLEKMKKRPNYTGKGSVIDIPLQEYLKKTETWRRIYKGYKVGVEYPHQGVRLDPYLLGLWLGDGTSSKPEITSADAEIISYFTNYASDHGLVVKKNPSDNYIHRITSGTRYGGIDRNHLKTTLRSYNLLNNKHIPNEYLYNSREIRLKVLAGLLDTDGSMCNNSYEITQKSEALSLDILTLCESLGFYCSMSRCTKTCTNSKTQATGTYYRMYINGSNISEIPVILPRKKLNHHNEKVDFLVSQIAVEKLSIGEYYGFELDGNGRFLLEDHTVTHNTSLVLACAREMYGDQMGRYILELNASDDRGIETVRVKIPNFVKSTTNKIKLVILDEVDAMTNDAQSALRRVIEKYSKNSRFCLICNNINKIIPGLQSRCTKMRFGYLDSTEITQKLRTIIAKENVQITDEALERLISINKDFRQILNTLQCLHIIRLKDGEAYQPIEPNDINQYLGVPTDHDIDSILGVLLQDSFTKACNTIINLFKDNQWNPSDLIHKLAVIVVNGTVSKKFNFTEKQKYFLIDHLSDIEFKLSHANDIEVQLYALVSAFQQSRVGGT